MERGLKGLAAKAAKCSAQHLSCITTGRARPSWLLAKRLEKVFGVHREIFLEGKPKEICKALDDACSNEHIRQAIKKDACKN